MEWYYVCEGRQTGPVDENGLQRLARMGTVTPETLLWRDGLDNWLSAKQAAPALFSAAPSPVEQVLTPIPAAVQPTTVAVDAPVSTIKMSVTGLLTVILVIGLLGMLVPSRLRGGISGFHYKMIASTAFFLIAMVGSSNKLRYPHWVLVAMGLCWLGDYYLGVGKFIPGLVAFLLGHVALIAAFLKLGIDKIWCLYGLVPALLFGLGAVLLMFSEISAAERIPVLLYTVVIATMVGAAVGTWPDRSSLLVTAGAILFYFSDLCVAMSRYLTLEFQIGYVGLPLYYAGVLLLALSVFTCSEDLEQQ